MKTFNPLPKAEMARRNQLLQQASTALKSHFVGIDAQIDQLIEHIRPWYLLPGQQERPRIVNLWGMTGVGKTDLIHQLIKLLDLQSRFFPVDLNNSSFHSNGLIDSLDHAHYTDARPAIFLLDEFQKARTLDKDGDEIPNANRFLWNLLDSGKISYVERDFSFDQLRDGLQQLELAVASGVQVTNGVVTDKVHTFCKITDERPPGHRSIAQEEDNDPYYFVNEDLLNTLWDKLKKQYPTRLQLRQKLLQLDGEGSLRLVQELFIQLQTPCTIDCSQDLLLIAGNLDSAYNFTHHTDPEIEADTVKSLNAQVGLTAIKRALLERFRPEQVARLGNNHVIYPAFSNEAFTELIRRGLERLSVRFEANTGVELLFEPSVHKLVYKEGVFPSQGTRPLFSTLENLAGSRLANWQLTLHELETPCQQIQVAQIGDKLVARFLAKQGGCLCEKSHELHLPLKKARKPKRDDKQALVAVHEAGHAVLSCALLGRVPAKVVSQSTDELSDGFVINDQRHDIVSKHYLLRMTAVFLGGLAAETLLFGEDHITLGSASDLREATRWLSKAYRKSGFTAVWAAYGPDGLNKPLLTLHEPQLEQAIHDTLAEARQLAFDTLQFEKGFLIALAGELANQQQMRRPQIERLRKVHMLGSMQSPLLNYRSQLLQMRQQQHLGQAQEPKTRLVLL